MAFLDDKEQVIEAELTQLGKYLLSEGKLKPSYYAFYDDDVLYDGLYTGLNELQNDIQTRIKEETPRSSLQYVFHGIETDIKRINKLVRSNQAKLGDDIIQPENDKFFSFSISLGNSSIHSEYLPSWNVTFLQGELSGSSPYIEGAHQTLKIPQLETSISYKTYVNYTQKIQEDESDPTIIPFDGLTTKIYDDESYLEVEENDLLLEIVEKNVDFINENFDIEVYRVENEVFTRAPGGIKERLIPLYFSTRGKQFQDTLLLEQDLQNSIISLDHNYVDYFFDVSVDGEIDEQEICKYREKNKIKSIFADSTYKCKINNNSTRDIYKDLENDIKDCDE